MWAKYISVCIVGTLLSLESYAQVIRGVVVDIDKNPVFPATITIKSNPNQYTITNLEGNFELNIAALVKDTLIISAYNYENSELPISQLSLSNNITIILKINPINLDVITIIGTNPISKRFAVSTLGAMDIYMAPVSQGDPLKAITSLPSSTNTDETSNPSLRGSSSSRSIVTLNGVPLHNPVRTNQLNNQGFFSLFKTELIGNEYIYPINPPLTYGNTSAGLVEIQTAREIRNNQLQFSVGLAGGGVFLSQELKEDITFVQAYANYQFSDLFIGTQPSSYPDLKNFNVIDGGVYLYSKLSENLELKSYTYLLREEYLGSADYYAYNGDVESFNKRLFTVNTLKYNKKGNVLSFNSGVSYAEPHMKYGNMSSNGSNRQLYASFDYKRYLSSKMDIQAGISYDGNQFRYADSIPIYYYALSPGAPTYYIGDVINNNSLDLYAYSNWDIFNNFSISLGLRSNIPLFNQEHYFSGQIGFKYNIGKQHSFILGAGKYHSYSTPTVYSQQFHLLSSKQLSLDYTLKLEKITLKAATYYKNEQGQQSLDPVMGSSTNHTKIFGVELGMEYDFFNYLKFTINNSYINQQVSLNSQMYLGPSNLNYFVKTAIEYNNPELFTVALSYMGRPGLRYNNIIGSEYIPEINTYMPIYNDWYDAQYSSYNRFDIAISKYFLIGNNAMTVFASVNNIFNNKNEVNAKYNIDYTHKSFSFYQLRSFFVGAVFYLNY